MSRNNVSHHGQIKKQKKQNKLKPEKKIDEKKKPLRTGKQIKSKNKVKKKIPVIKPKGRKTMKSAILSCPVA